MRHLRSALFRTVPEEGGGMRNDERYKPEPRSCQLELFGLGAAGQEDAEAAEAWIEENPDAWEYMVRNAYRLRRKGFVSMNYLVNMVRNELLVAVKNGLSPAFARIMVERHPDLEDAFKVHRARCDAFAGVGIDG